MATESHQGCQLQSSEQLGKDAGDGRKLRLLQVGVKDNVNMHYFICFARWYWGEGRRGGAFPNSNFWSAAYIYLATIDIII